MAEKFVELEIKRCAGPGQPSHWERYRFPYRPSLNVIILLQEIRRNPVTAEGKRVTPPSYESCCLEEVCGICTMIVNGRVRQACTCLVDELKSPIRLEPMTRFPLIRDLVVDRSFIYETFKKVRAWIPVDGTYDLGPGPRTPAEKVLERYPFSRCITCGSCLEACPQVHAASSFIGAAAIGQVKLMNMHPTGAMNADERLEALMGPGGVAHCGNAQNCVEVCPKKIPLTQAIADMRWSIDLLWLRKLLVRGDKPVSH